jgi:hypothetical protein
MLAPLFLLVLQGPAAAQQIGCFSDGDFVYLHVGTTYQYYVDRGEQPVDCTPDAVSLGLELTEEAMQASCVDAASTLCQENQQYVTLIRETYGEALRQAGAASSPPEPAGEAAVAEPARQREAVPAVEQPVAAEPEVRLGSRETIRWVQKSLKQLGYNPGPIDGALGRRTAAAIKRYEQRNDMPVTGKMSKALVASLSEQVGQ